MTEVCTTPAADAGGTLLETIEPVELWATYPGGGSLNVERFDDEKAVGVAIGQHPQWADKVRHVVVTLAEDEGDTQCLRIDAVAFHSDVSVHSDPRGLRDIDRAIDALRAAREALLTAGMVRS